MNSFESGIVEAVQKISTPFLDVFFKIITAFGGLWIILVVFALLLLFCGTRVATKYAFVMSVSSLIGTLVKIITRRQRPFMFSPDVSQIGYATGYSFISGHMLTAVITALFIFLTVRKSVKRTSLKAALAGIFIIAVAAVGFSRIYLGVHYLSDVAAAFVLGIALYWILSFTYDKLYDVFIERRYEVKNNK